MGVINDLVDRGRDRVVDSTTALFSHAPRPLEHTLDHLGDPGLLGPDSVSWPVIGDATAFVGGIRGLLVQAAHPEVVAGVDEHSRYRVDPLGRLSRTSAYVTATTFGAMPEVERAVAMVRGAHRGVVGRSERGRPYSADQPELAGWVHNALTDSFLAAYRAYGPDPLSDADADRFVAEQTRIGRLLVDGPLPETASDLRAHIVDHPAIDASAATAAAVEFLRDPPLPAGVKLGYGILYRAALAITPPRILEVLGETVPRGAEPIGRRTVGALRWALGSSPSWHVSLIRTGAEIPQGRFRQPLTPEAARVLADREATA